MKKQGGMEMGTVIIFGLVCLLAVVAAISSLKNKNILGLLLSVSAAAVFGFFTIMTILKDGFPNAN